MLFYYNTFIQSHLAYCIVTSASIHCITCVCHVLLKDLLTYLLARCGAGQAQWVSVAVRGGGGAWSCVEVCCNLFTW